MIDISLFSNHSPSEWFSEHKKTKPGKRTGFVLNEYNQMEMELATSISLGSMVLCMDSATLTS